MVIKDYLLTYLLVGLSFFTVLHARLTLMYYSFSWFSGLLNE